MFLDFYRKNIRRYICIWLELIIRGAIFYLTMFRRIRENSLLLISDKVIDLVLDVRRKPGEDPLLPHAEVLHMPE